MIGFGYRAGVLHAEDVPIPTLAAAVGTPFYCYSTRCLEANYDAFAAGFAAQRLPVHIAYGIKANDNLAVIATLARRGAGVDVVSGGEVRRALEAGVAADRIVFSGVGKSRDELILGLETGIRQFNVESEGELALLNTLAVAMKARAPVALRVNPDVDARSHDKITTGRKGDKFGIAFDAITEVYAQAGSLPGIERRGLALHIGSQITDLAPFRAAFGKIVGLVRALRQGGHAVMGLDLGGGLGIVYRAEQPPTAAAYAAMVADVVRGLDLELTIEPGRSIAATAGILVTSVLYVKPAGEKTILVVDAAMNDLMRPAMYDAYHPVRPVLEAAAAAPRTLVDIVGPICESSDVLARGREIAAIASGHMLVIEAAGAYGRAMASCYNSRPLIPEIMVRGDRFQSVRRRPTFAESIALEAIPDWLGAGSAKGAA
ncbi:MAG: diaminopimelate decarboxylase [Alphaproteobacteria bacterium]|nr:diaminopimelate decarboxylase [Alphaproteobacteria bacterium]